MCSHHLKLAISEAEEKGQPTLVADNSSITQLQQQQQQAVTLGVDNRKVALVFNGTVKSEGGETANNNNNNKAVVDPRSESDDSDCSE